MIRRDCLKKVGLYSTQFKDDISQGCEDWDLYLRIALHYQFQVVPYFLLGYRKLPGSMSSDFSSMARWHNLVLKVAAERYREIPTVLYRVSRSNLYMYLARQSYHAGNYKDTFSWLYRSLKAECVSPLLRYGFYKMAFKSLLKILLRSFLPVLDTDGKAIKRKLYFRNEKAKEKIGIADIEQWKMNISIKVLIWSVFHALVSGVAGLERHRKSIIFTPYKY